jgi:hypothetical protein
MDEVGVMLLAEHARHQLHPAPSADVHAAGSGKAQANS